MKATAIFLLLLRLLPLVGWSQTRTWTFTQDGKIESGAGVWSFRKGGRIDAEFVRLDGTNTVILRSNDNEERGVPFASLSQADRAYVESLAAKVQLERAQLEQDKQAMESKAVSDEGGRVAICSRLIEKSSQTGQPIQTNRSIGDAFDFAVGVKLDWPGTKTEKDDEGFWWTWDSSDSHQVPKPFAFLTAEAKNAEMKIDFIYAEAMQVGDEDFQAVRQALFEKYGPKKAQVDSTDHYRWSWRNDVRSILLTRHKGYLGFQKRLLNK